MKSTRSKAKQDVMVAYVRVSTSDQANGPEAQRAAIEAYAARNSLKIAAIHSDIGVSGAAPLDRRLGLLSAVADIKIHRATGLLVAKRDRLARDVMASLLIQKMVTDLNARVVSADGVSDANTPEAEMMRTILDTFAQYERAVIRARTKAALASKKARGELVGSVPYGNRLASDGVHVEPCELEQVWLDKIHQLHRRGFSQRKIAAALNAAGAPARGARWHPTSIARILAD